MTVIITGTAGFIGFHLAKKYLNDGLKVIGLDNCNTYYDVTLKRARLAELQHFKNFQQVHVDISNENDVMELASNFQDVEYIVHLAAQAGVRYSLENPYAYVDSNLKGQVVMLELAKLLKNLKHFVYASSSSVYGKSTDYPLALNDRCEAPRSLYAATKRSCEHLAYSYSDMYNLPITGLRFFTVYGPWGRPDMAAWIFTKAITEGKPISIFNNGKMERDFTYIDDIISGVEAVMRLIPKPDKYNVLNKVYNLGNSTPTPLMDMIGVLEDSIGKKAIKNFEPMQVGDVVKTFADISSSENDFGFKPKTKIEEGLPKFVQWYLNYHNLR